MTTLIGSSGAELKTDLVQRLESAYVFRVSLENGTALQNDLEAGPSGTVTLTKAVANRMLYQLADRPRDYRTFLRESALGSYEISDVINEFVKSIGKEGAARHEQPCIILLIDGVQTLPSMLPIPRNGNTFL